MAGAVARSSRAATRAGTFIGALQAEARQVLAVNDMDGRYGRGHVILGISECHTLAIGPAGRKLWSYASLTSGAAGDDCAPRRGPAVAPQARSVVAGSDSVRG